MADVKWIKIVTDIFDDEKILLIESLPEADSIIVIWFKLLCLAGKQNNDGVFMLNDTIPYTDKMLATIFRRKESTVSLALKTFQQFGMVEVVENVITIPNWGKHQSLEQINARKEYQREYQRQYRAHQKQLAAKESEGSKHSRKHLHEHSCDDDVNALEGEKEEDKNKIRERNIDYAAIQSLFNSICTSLPQIKSMTDARRKKIKARLQTFSLEDIETAFRKAQASDFMTGRSSDWQASFDWIMNSDSNITKILEGNYDNRKGKQPETKNTGVDPSDLTVLDGLF